MLRNPDVAHRVVLYGGEIYGDVTYGDVSYQYPENISSLVQLMRGVFCLIQLLVACVV